MNLTGNFTVAGMAAKSAASTGSAVWNAVANGGAWAKYLSVEDENGKRAYAPAQLRFVNCDPSRGGLKAVYFASVDCGGAVKYVRVSLCSDMTAAGEVSGAQIDYTGNGGETAEITATVRLTVSGDDVCFCGGNNKLVKRLLGCGEAFDIKLGWGTCAYPSRVCVRTDDLISEKLDATAVAETDGVKIYCDAPTYGSELVLFAGSEALLRALRPYEYDIRAVNQSVEGCSVLLDKNIPVSVSNARLDNVSMLRVDTCTVCENIMNVKSDNVVNLGVAGSVKSDPGEEYIAVISAAYVEVYKVDSLDPSLVLRVPHADEYVEMCRGGALALWSATEITVYEPDENGEYDSFTVSVPSGDDRILVREGTRYHGGYRRSVTFYRFELTRTGYTVLHQIRVSATAFFIGRCGDAIAYGGKTLTVKLLDTDMGTEYTVGGLASDTATRTAKKHGDCFMVITAGGVDTVYDFIHGTTKALDSTVTVRGRLLYDDESAYIYDYKNGVRKISGNYDLSGATGACIAGDGLFAVRGGKLYAYYMNGTAKAVRLPAGSDGKTFFCNVREKVLSGAGGKASFSVCSDTQS